MHVCSSYCGNLCFCFVISIVSVESHAEILIMSYM